MTVSAQAKTADIDASSGEISAEAPSKKKMSGKKLTLFVALPLVLLIGGGAAAYMTGMVGGGETADDHASVAKEEGAASAAKSGPAVFYDLPELLVNLNSNGRRTSFLKLQVSLEIGDAQDKAKLDAMRPRIVDGFQVYLRELRIEDLRGSSGMYRLREELLARVNTAVAPAKVKDVLFKEVLVQ
jgi:flagellar FliL protein